MQLDPLEIFTIARGLEDPSDTTQYYVQAVIRNAKTDALIATVNLTDQGDHHRYSAPWQVPADQTGLGFYLLITTSVYTDSGYTTKASTYGDKYDTYLVQRRFNYPIDIPDLDYERIRKMVREEITAVEAAEEPEEPEKPLDFSPLSDALQAILSEVRAIAIPEAKEVDYGRLEAKIEAVDRAVKAIRIPETDLTEFLALIKELATKMDEMKVANISQAATDINGLLTRIKQFFGNDMDQMNEKMEKLGKKFDKIAYVTLQTNAQNDD